MATHNFKAKVARLYVTRGKTNIRLKLPANEQPAESYFALPQTHSNYSALYSLALSAAINGSQLAIRTTQDIDPGDPAEVMYMVVDW
ncbi:MAG TPA: hypothetical protein VIT65_26800 [Microlunatus sp.]